MEPQRPKTHEIGRQNQILGARQTRWPKPTTKSPTISTVEFWIHNEYKAKATDGCDVELDGTCQHGYPSWPLYLGLI